MFCSECLLYAAQAATAVLSPHQLGAFEVWDYALLFVADLPELSEDGWGVTGISCSISSVILGFQWRSYQSLSWVIQGFCHPCSCLCHILFRLLWCTLYLRNIVILKSSSVWLKFCRQAPSKVSPLRLLFVLFKPLNTVSQHISDWYLNPINTIYYSPDKCLILLTVLCIYKYIYGERDTDSHFESK